MRLPVALAILRKMQRGENGGMGKREAGRRSHSRPRLRPSCSSPPHHHPRHHLLWLLSAFVPIVYSIFGRPSPFPIVLSVHHPPPVPLPSQRLLHSRSDLPIVLASHRPRQFPLSPCRPRCLSRSTHRLHRSRSLPSVFPIHHPPPVSLPSQRLPHSRSDLPIVLSSPRQSSPASVPALSLPPSPFLITVLDSDAIFFIPDRRHHFPHYTLPSSVSVPALSHLSSPTPTKAILAVVVLVLLP
ncbi:hypothetical protein ACLOJK_019539 [Asimina triloba]